MRNTQRAGVLVQSVERALRVLEVLRDEPGGLGVTEIAERLGVHKATASRLAATLAEFALVERSPVTDKFRLGFGLVRLADVAVGGLQLVQQARSVLHGLAEQTHETVNLAVLDGDRVVNIAQVNGSPSVVSVNWVGKHTPLHCTSSGKVLLAFLPAREQTRLLGNLGRLTPHTIVDADALRRHLDEVRERGFAFTFEELEVGLNAVAAPVRGAAGDPIAAISVAGPSYRLSPDRIDAVAELTQAAAEEVSRRMGYAERRELVGTR